MKRLLLVDGNNFVHRAYHRFKKLEFTNREGFPTTAIYGFKNMIERLLKDYNPEYICICFDSKEETFRHKIYSQYKGERSKNSIVGMQYEHIRKWCTLMGIPWIAYPGYEADDIIGTLVWKYKYGPNFEEILIFSNDKDMMQLVRPNVKQVDTMRNIVYDIKGVIQKLGVHPMKVVTYLSLVGDKSDNIPGCAGIGKTGAPRIINEFGPLLTHIHKNLSRMKEKDSRKIKKDWDNIALSYKLAKIRNIQDLKVDIGDLHRYCVDEEGLNEFYHKFDIKGEDES